MFVLLRESDGFCWKANRGIVGKLRPEMERKFEMIVLQFRSFHHFQLISVKILPARVTPGVGEDFLLCYFNWFWVSSSPVIKYLLAKREISMHSRLSLPELFFLTSFGACERGVYDLPSCCPLLEHQVVRRPSSR
ncbi:hypothetical protein CEXT_683661 [Caerostris extrusa]|uniref:Uncharacterized protein n=1 Tax=Caerostris extrusa TaxID=172846 RepID=A0AAV4Q1D6_CAEEX|nr:hypothetical protein CEXT_683661 [Caerostris extrusa]